MAWSSFFSYMGMGVFFLAGIVLAKASHPTETLWAHYKERFIKSGRVVDDGQRDITHSEGQGYAMLFAVSHDDQETFDDLWAWTKENLQTRETDVLFCWKWERFRSAPGGGKVTDANNASDGDILIAWALARAADKWGDEKYFLEALRICQDVRKLLLRPSPYGPILLPGIEGFERKDGVVINPSYWVFPAFIKLAQVDPSPEWRQLFDSGMKMLQEARFGRFGLPGDWVQIAGPKFSLPKEDFESVYGYNAIRVPMHLWWAGVNQKEYYRPYHELIQSLPEDVSVPATVDLATDTLGKDPALPGMQQVYQLIGVDRKTQPEVNLLSISAEEPYYSVSLKLLCALARAEAAYSTTP